MLRGLSVHSFPVFCFVCLLSLSCFCLCLSFSPGFCPWSSLFVSVLPQALSVFLSEPSLTVLFPVSFPSSRWSTSGREDWVEWSRLDSWAAGELMWPAQGGHAAGWEGDRTPVTKPAPHFLLGVAGVGSMCAAPGWELPGPGPALDAGVRGRKEGAGIHFPWWCPWFDLSLSLMSLLLGCPQVSRSLWAGTRVRACV